MLNKRTAAIGIIILMAIIIIFQSCLAKSKAEPVDLTGYEKVYTSVEIKRGDSIEGSLYDEYGYGYSKGGFKKEVVFINNLTNPDKIKAGNYIILPHYIKNEP